MLNEKRAEIVVMGVNGGWFIDIFVPFSMEVSSCQMSKNCKQKFWKEFLMHFNFKLLK